MKKIILACFILVSCTSSVPKRDFEVTLYESDYDCLEWYNAEEDRFEVSCRGEDGHPKNIRAISIEDYQKERDYQDLLINKCRKWKE